MTWHYEPWQKALEIALVMFMSFSFGMIVVAVRGPRRVRMSVPQRQKLGVAGGVVFALTLLAWTMTEQARRPIARPAPVLPATP